MQRAIIFIAFLLMLIFLASLGNLETYRIHMLKPGNTTDYLSEEDLLNYYLSILPSSAEFIGLFRPLPNNFMARLTFEEVKAMRYMEGFIFAIPDTGCYTTFSLNLWDGHPVREESACRPIEAPGNTFSEESIKKGVSNKFWGW